MSTENQKTLEVYEKYADKFLQGCKDRATERGAAETSAKDQWQQDFLLKSFRPIRTGTIFEAGSGDCANAVFLRGQGYDMTTSDIATGFLKVQKQNGFNPTKFNLLTDDFSKKYQGILAWHVLLHFTTEDLRLALSKIYDALMPGGRFVCDIQNLDDKADEFSIVEGSSRWIDYGGAYHIGAERFFQYWTEADFRAELAKVGFKIVDFAKTGGDSGERWLVFACEKPWPVSEPVQEYINTEILPRYSSGRAHGDDHIRQVMIKSVNFATEINAGRIKNSDWAGCPEKQINCDMSYAIAAYHDLGRIHDEEPHELVGAKILREDEKLRKFFTPEQIETMAVAVEDHRASSDHDPRNVYGRIVSSADRDTNPYLMVKKAYSKQAFFHPERPEAEKLEEVREHLRKKYGGKNAYAAKHMYFENPDFVACLEKIDRITADAETFAEYAKEVLAH